MAFSTIQGSGGAPDSFVGTSGVDSITLINSAGNFFLGAQQANDFVNFVNTSLLSSGLIDNAQIRAGDGNDTILGFGGAVGLFSGVNFNGNAGNDLINFAATDSFVNSSIFGGQGDDTINTGTLTASVVNGNKGVDVITTTGVATNSSIYGGQGNDTININTSFTNSLVSGDLGNDIIRTGAQPAVAFTVSGSTFLGGAGTDNINLSTVTTGTGALIDGGADADILVGTGVADTILGGDGNDTITGGAGADRITGGVGADLFIQVNLASFVASAAIAASTTVYTFALAGGVDVITDFSFAAGDLLRITGHTGVVNNSADGNGATIADDAIIFRGTFANNAFVAGDGLGNDLFVYLATEADAAGDGFAAAVIGTQGVILQGAGTQLINTAQIVAA